MVTFGNFAWELYTESLPFKARNVGQRFAQKVEPQLIVNRLSHCSIDSVFHFFAVLKNSKRFICFTHETVRLFLTDTMFVSKGETSLQSESQITSAGVSILRV